MRADGPRRFLNRVGVAGVALALALTAALPAGVLAASDGSRGRSADLNGKPIALDQVGRYYCHDFTHPAIHCYSTSAELETAVSQLATTGVNYVIVYDFTTYQGGYMYMSDNYTVLATIGWNDRISSFRALNGFDGRFFTDWFYGGTGYYFCCNQNVGSLGSFDNTFSSVAHY